MSQGKSKRLSKKSLVFISVLVVFAAAVTTVFALIYQKGYHATSMRLLRVEGTVNIETANGGTKPVIDNIRFQSGDALNTGADGLASVGLDDTKIITLQNDSRAEFTKQGKHLELKLTKGAVFFNVTEKLQPDETFEIKTSTMTAGIRGTSGYVYYDESGRDALIITDGSVEISATNPVTGETKTAKVEGGQGATVYLYSDREENTVSFTLEEIGIEDLNDFTVHMIAENEELLNRVCDYTGWDKQALKDVISSIPSTTPTQTPTPIPSGTQTPTPTQTLTPTPTLTPSETPTPTAAATVTPPGTPTPSTVPSVTPTVTPTPTGKPSVTPTATPKPTATVTPKPTATSTPKPTATSTPTPTATTAPEPSAIPEPTPDPTPVPEAGYTIRESCWNVRDDDGNLIFITQKTVGDDKEYRGYKDGAWIDLTYQAYAGNGWADADFYSDFDNRVLYYSEELYHYDVEPPTITPEPTPSIYQGDPVYTGVTMRSNSEYPDEPEFIAYNSEGYRCEIGSRKAIDKDGNECYFVNEVWIDYSDDDSQLTSDDAFYYFNTSEHTFYLVPTALWPEGY